MKTPESLATLMDYGIIREVIRPLMSGKEAQVYVVVAGGEECVAKVYKEANQRTFKHRSSYMEGRRTRNSRDQRAMSKHTQHGRKKDEDAWRTTEVEMIYRLRDAGVRVPEPINFVDGVLVMELVKDADGHPAPRLGDLMFSPRRAHEIYLELIREVVRMLCAGVIHGDLSDFNVLMSLDGPVLIDFPQSVDPTRNPNGKELLLRDVDNLHRFLARFAPDEPVRPHGEEIWSLYQANRLEPDTGLTGRYRAPEGRADTAEVMALIEDASRDERMRRDGRRADDDVDDEYRAPAPFRTVVDFASERKPRPSARARDGEKRGARPARRRRGGKKSPAPAANVPARPSRSEATTADAAKPAGTKRPRRRGRGRRRVAAGTHTKSQGAKAGTSAGARGGGDSDAQSEAKRPAKPAASSSHAPAPRARVGTDRPTRKRRRRPRKSSSSR